MTVTVDMPVVGIPSWFRTAIKDALTFVYQHNADVLEREVGGVFLQAVGGSDVVFLEMPNIAEEDDEFEFAAVEVADHMRRKDLEFVGLFHTHPGGTAEPSGADMEQAKAVEGSAWGSGLQHWLYAPSGNGNGTLVAYDAYGTLTKLVGKFCKNAI